MHVWARVDEEGNLPALHTGLPAGTEVEVLVELDDKVAVRLENHGWLKLAQSSMAFWDNPVDDEVWNNA